MSRIHSPDTIAQFPAASQPLLVAVQKSQGAAPIFFWHVGPSPAALEGTLGSSTALVKGHLTAVTQERLALAIANDNACPYCKCARAFLAKNIAHVNDVEIQANRTGKPTDAKTDTAAQFALMIANFTGRSVVAPMTILV